MFTDFGRFDDTLRIFDHLQERIESAFGPWVDPLGERTFRRVRAAWPPTNVLETKEAFVVKVDVPGLTDGDVSVSVEDDALVIRGERKSDVPEGYRVLVRERAALAFTRKLPLPARVEGDAVTAKLSEGVLTVTLPKAKEALPRQIAVKAS